MPQNISTLISENPGQALREILTSIFPYSTKAGVLSRIDEALHADGELLHLIYNSTITYLLRRLITSANHIKRNCERTALPEEEFNRRLRTHLRGNFEFDERTNEKIFTLLKECLIKQSQNISQKTTTEVQHQAQRAGNPHCYICGVQVTFSIKGAWDTGEVEHAWPRSLGGPSIPENLRIACRKCNHEKKNRLDSADFHYESICLITDKPDESFEKEFSYEYKLAILLKNQQNKCSKCHRKADRGEQLTPSRINRDDSWHYLNMQPTCSIHTETEP